jgi:macrolide resistance protein
MAGGALSDRIGARQVLIGSDIGAALAAGAGSFLALTGWGGLLPVIACLALANLLGSPGNIAQDARVPELARLARVPVERGNGLRDISANVGLTLGPAAGVILVETAGLAGTLAAATAVLLSISLADALLFPRFRIHPRPPESTGSGFGAVLADPVLRVVAGVGVLLVAIFGSLDEILAPSLALRSGLGAGGLTRFLVILGGAALVSATLYAARGHRAAPRRLFVGGVGLAAAGFAMLALLPPFWAMLVAPAVLGLGIGPMWSMIMTAIQRRVPPHGRGAAIGALGGTVLAVQPFAAVTAGPAIAWAGLTPVLYVLAAGGTLAAAVAVAAPGLREMDGGG